MASQSEAALGMVRQLRAIQREKVGFQTRSLRPTGRVAKLGGLRVPMRIGCCVSSIASINGSVL